VSSAGGPPLPWNERLDHLQAAHPLRYNLVTGTLIGLVVVAFGFQWVWAVAYIVCWAGIRAFLWQDGRVLRRQYDERQVRVAAERVARGRAR
jgi:hypothetical protein